jgi:hypothetical protein
MGLCAEVYTVRTSWRQLFREGGNFLAWFSACVDPASRTAALNRSFLREERVKSRAPLKGTGERAASQSKGDFR